MDYLSTTTSLSGGGNTKKTLLILSTVFFAVGVVLLIIMLLKKSPAPKPIEPVALARGQKVTELESEQEARDALSNPQPAMVFLFAEWCGFCKKMNPVYDELSTNPAYRHIKLLKLNASKAGGLAKENGVTGFPTFLTNWGKGKHVGYKDLPKMQEILSSAKGGARLAHSSRGAMTTSEAEVVAALQDKSPAIVFVSADSCGFCKKMIPVWDEVARGGKFNHIKMMRIDGKHARELIKANGVTGFPAFLTNRGEGKYVGFRPKEQFEELLVKIGKV
jgi:thiol-disulfide isomerase/thioredoxin